MVLLLLLLFIEIFPLFDTKNAQSCWVLNVWMAITSITIIIMITIRDEFKKVNACGALRIEKRIINRKEERRHTLVPCHPFLVFFSSHASSPSRTLFVQL